MPVKSYEISNRGEVPGFHWGDNVGLTHIPVRYWKRS